ncbi:MAG TPA: hypothetical protein VL171_05840 [Verrucomicrobiae bacterium]|nr:hypothetical protein [Verrucomicrobiae bacterium]
MSHIGINIGALTVKVVVVRGDARHGKVAAHQGRPLEVLDDLLAEAEFADAECSGMCGQLGHLPEATAIHRVPARVHLIALPPYSPELNPVEMIGDLIKDRIGNTLWTTIEALEEALGEELRPIYRSAERVRRLVSHPWPIDQANATEEENSAVTC